MHVYFSAQEKEWLIMEPFNWRVKKGCPVEIKKTIEEKLKLIKHQNDKNA